MSGTDGAFTVGQAGGSHVARGPFQCKAAWTAGGGKLADRSPAGPCLPQTPELARVGLSFSGSNRAKAAGLVVTSEPAVPGHPAYPP